MKSKGVSVEDDKPELAAPLVRKALEERRRLVAALEARTREYVEDYEMRDDSSSYIPTAGELMLLHDCAAGLINEFLETLDALAAPPPPIPEKTDDAVFIAARHVGISRDATRRLLGTLNACGLCVVRSQSPSAHQSVPSSAQPNSQAVDTKTNPDGKGET